jgi:hypothetical protein
MQSNNDKYFLYLKIFKENVVARKKGVPHSCVFYLQQLLLSQYRYIKDKIKPQ